MTLHRIFRKKMLITTILLVLAAAAWFFFLRTGKDKSVQYKFVSVTKGNIENVISSSGTLGPVAKVEVGTQVSGTIDKVLVDYNDKVKKGQIIAELDVSLLNLAVTDASSGLIKAKSQFEESESAYKRNLKLYEKGLLAESDLQTSKTAFESAKASVTIAEVALKRAELNMKYAIIRSPIDGTVIDRNVEEGQTVAASFSTPTLFIIAEDMSKMEIQAAVDESDIGDIKMGMSVRFTVQAYPDRKFRGVVKQIRVQPTTTSNVVNYTVVVSAENEEGLLLPGMTATVDFIVSSKTGVYIVPSGALKFQPSEDELADNIEEMKKNAGAPPPDSIRKKMFPGSSGAPSKDSLQSTIKQLWFLDESGRLTMIPVRTGITDGTNTEILESPMLKEGMKVISGNNSSKDEKTGTTKSQSGPPGGGPPPF
ncbi:MAG TPA: efflux RND transporter periplasmic adaptor subunit [Ignavibacteria bacterium]|nr:efflux RND transporter periplasmic adaptor subunit [Ignavibacteria bacterium]